MWVLFGYYIKHKCMDLDYSKDSKNFWSIVVKNAETSFIPHFIKYGRTFAHSAENANTLAEMFSKNSSLSESDQPLPFMQRASCTMPEVQIRTREVKRVLSKLKKSSERDGIPARVLEICSSSLAPQFVLYFV